jgi:rubrerythrin
MTKKARRRQIMEAVDYPEKRVHYFSEDTFAYKRSGELLKEELKQILIAIGDWKSSYKTNHKRAYRGHIRNALDIEYESQMGWESFTKSDLTQIWREVDSCNSCGSDTMFDDKEEESYCPICES